MNRRRRGGRCRCPCASPFDDLAFTTTHSGDPMAVPLLDLKAQHQTIRDEMVKAVIDVVDSQLFILGDKVKELECEVAGLSHTKFAIGCANGTDAILLAMRAL